MSKQYLYFQRDVVFLGKHARYIDEMWTQERVEEKDYFNRLYELYVLAGVVGLRMGRRAPLDASDGNKRTIQFGNLSTQRDKLEVLMKLVLLVDETSGLSNEDKVNRAFRGPKSDEEFEYNVDLFNSYVRGGIEFLYEELKLRILDLDDKYTDQRVGNIMALLQNPFDKAI